MSFRTSQAYIFYCCSWYTRGCPRGVMVKALNFGIVVSEFELQLRYYVHFRGFLPLGKVWTPWSTHLWVKKYYYCPSKMMGLALKNLRRLIYYEITNKQNHDKRISAVQLTMRLQRERDRKGERRGKEREREKERDLGFKTSTNLEDE